VIAFKKKEGTGFYICGQIPALFVIRQSMLIVFAKVIHMYSGDYSELNVL